MSACPRARAPARDLGIAAYTGYTGRAMDHRAKIPGLALLSLSFTTCVERSPVDPQDGEGIVGEWHAVAIDGDKFPQRYSEGAIKAEINVELEVEQDLSGSLRVAYDEDYDGYISHEEQGSVLTVDADGAPKYVLEVKRDLFGHDDGATTVVATATVTVGEATGYDGTSGYDSAAPTTGDASTDGVVESGRGETRPLQIPVHPSAGPAAMILRCTLDGDTLTCDRDGSDEPRHWVFERTVDPADA